MSSDLIPTVQGCPSCARACGTVRKYQNDLKLFPAAGLLQLVAMDILGPLSSVSLSSSALYSYKHPWPPLTATRSGIIRCTRMAPPTYVFSDEGRQAGAKRLDAVCAMLERYALSHDCSPPETNEQI